MFLISFLKGVFVGLVVSVPTGPVGFLSVKRTINDGFRAGFITGLGVVTSDLVYGIIVIIGLRHTALFFIDYKPLIHLVGGFVLIVLGSLTYLSKKIRYKKASQSDIDIEKMEHIAESRIGQFLSAFFVTMLNPIQIISFTALLGPLAVFHDSFNLSVLFLSGLLFGSLVWWTSLSFIVSKIRTNFTNAHVLLVNKIAGAVILGSGILIIIQLFVD